MMRSMLRGVVLATSILGLLAACASQSGGRKSAAVPPPAATVGQDGVRATATRSAHRRSPYAPAREDPRKRGDYTAGGLYAPGIKDRAPDAPLHDVDLIPEPEVVDEPRSAYGNRSPYKVLGKTYTVRESAAGHVETGIGSYYGTKFHARRTSNLEVYDMYAFTAAHKSLPLPSFARVTNLENGKSVIVRVNDRGPFHDGRIIDLSYAAAVKLGYHDKGTAPVEVRGLTPDDVRPPTAAGSAAALPPASAGTGSTPPRSVPTVTAMDRLIGTLPAAAGGSATSSSQPAMAWRFHMQQNGRTMTADEFDAWMKARRANVATGKPIRLASAAPVRPPTRAEKRRAASAEKRRRQFQPHSGDGIPVSAAPAVQTPPRLAAASPVGGADKVTLQVASFSNPAKADQALATLLEARIVGARVLGADVDGRKVWRLRVGPMDAARASSLAAQVAGLGFGRPQHVRE